MMEVGGSKVRRHGQNGECGVSALPTWLHVLIRYYMNVHYNVLRMHDVTVPPP